MNPSFRRPIRRILAGSIAALAVISAQSVRAQTWNGGGGDDNWGTGANWLGGSSPSTGTGTSVFFDGSTRLTPFFNYSPYDQMGSIFFNSGAGAFTLSGNPIKIFSKIENSGSTAQTVSFSVLVLNGTTSTEINPVSGDLLITSPIFLDTPVLNVYGNNGKTVTFSGVIADGNQSGGFSLLQNSTAVFSAANIYTGTTLLDAGTLQLASGGSITTSAIQIGSGATFDVNGQTATVKSISEQGGGDGGSVKLGSGSLTVNNAGGGTKFFNNLGLSGDTGSFTLNSAGSTLELYGASLYTGTTTVQNGTLNLQSTAALASGAIVVSGGTLNSGGSNLLADSASVTVSSGTLALGANSDTVGAVTLQGGTISSSTGVLTGSAYGVENGTLSAILGGSGALTKSTSGTVTLGGANTYTGATSVTNGVLELTANNALGTTAGSTTVSSGGTLRLNSLFYTTAEALSIAGNGAAAGALAATGTSSYAGAVTVASNAKISSTGTLTLTGGVIKNGTTATFTGGGTINISTVGISGASANSDLVVDGVTLVLNVANTYNGPTSVINSGTLRLGASNVLPTSPATDFSVTSSTFDMQTFSDQIATLTLSGGTVSGSGTLTLGGDVASSGTSSIAPGLALGASRTFTISGGTTTASGVVSGAGFGLTKAGAGTLVLANANTFDGGVTINAGTVQLGNATGLGPAASAALAFGPSSTGTLQLNGNNVTVIGLNTDATPGTPIIESGSGTAGTDTLTVSNAASNTYAGLLRDGSTRLLALTKSGAGTLTLSNANTYTGLTTISGGILKLGNAASLGSTTGSTLLTAGALDLNGKAVGAEALTINGTGISSGGAVINSSGTAASLSGLVTLGSASSIGGTGNFTLSGGVAGEFNLIKTGAGTVTLSAAATRSTSAGTTQIDGGVLRIQSGTALNTGTTAVTTINNSGTLELNGGITLNQPITLNTGGTLRSDGSNTSNGTTTVTAAASVTLSTVAGGDVFTIGNASNDLTGGSGATIHIAGPGTVYLNQTSDYTGNWALDNGTARLGTAAAMGATPASTVTLNAGATMAGYLAATTTFTANPVTVAGNATVLADRSAAGGTVTYNFGALSIGGQTLSATNTAAFTSGTAGITFGATTLTGSPTFNVNLAAGGATSMTLTLGAIAAMGGNTISATGNGILAQSGIWAGSGNITLPGGFTGVVALSQANTYTGNNTVNGGTLQVSNANALGNAANIATVNATGTLAASGVIVLANSVVLNGGTLSQPTANQLSFVAANTVTIGTGGGTVDVSGGGGSTSKILLGAAQLLGSTTLTKTGAGVLQLGAANAGFSGAVLLNAGTVEFQNADALGTGTTTVTISGTGDFALNSGAVNGARHNFVLNTGGTISANGTLNAVTYTSPINVVGNANAALRLFQTTTSANGFTITGVMSGAGGLNVTAPAAATLNIGTSATSWARSITETAYTGNITAGTNATVAVNNALGSGGFTLAGGTVAYKAINTTAPTIGTAGVNATYYNFGSTQTTASALFASSLLQGAPFVASRTDANINMPQPGSNGDYPILPLVGFGVAGAGGLSDGIMWKGLLTINTAGSYQFSGTDDDNAQLYIDGQLVGTLSVNSGSLPIGAAITLAAGTHSLVYKFTQGTGGGYTTLSYNGADTSSATVLVGSGTGALTNGSMAASALGPLSFTLSSTLDLSTDATATTLSIASGVTATFTSPTISGLTISGATTLNGGTATISNTSAALALNGAIGQSVASALTISGGYLTSFNAINTYTGLTTVTAGELDLNATGGNSLSTGGLTISAANATGTIGNVRLLQANQIADAATVTVTSGALDIGAFNETVGTLTLNGATGTLTNAPAAINGTTGVLTATTLDLRVGTVNAILAGAAGLAKSTAGTLILTGNNTYTGVTAITAGTLVVRGTNALGAGGAGNETTVTTGSLQLQGASIGSENLTINGALFTSIGNSTINNLTTGSASTLFVDGGDLTLNGVLNVAGGALTKTGSGALTFNSNQATIPLVTLSAGALGFTGTQGFGAVAVPAGLAYRFNSDPSAAVTLTAGAGTTVIAGYAAANTLLSRITLASAGTLALATDSSAALNFTGSSLKLGAQGLATYSGALTPNGTTYQFGGTSVSGLAPNILNVTSTLSGANSVNISGGIVNLAANNNDSATAGLYSGGVTVTGGILRALNDPAFGTASSVITLNGGTLQYTTVSVSNTATEFGFMGSGIGGSARTINIAAGGGTIDVAARGYGGSSIAVTQANTITGAIGTTLTKSGFGQLFVLAPIDGTSTGFKGNLVIAPNSGQINILGAGDVRGLASVTVGQSGIFQVDNNTGLGQGREFVYTQQLNPLYSATANSPLVAAGTENDKIGDTIPITLNGGTLLFQGRNVALGLTLGGFERVGTVTAGLGQDTISVVRTGTGGAEMAVNNLVRAVGGGTVNLLGQNLGTTGDNARLVPFQINGVAPVTNSFVGGWLTVNSANFGTFLTQASTGLIGGVGAYGTTGFASYTALTLAATAPGTNGWTTGTIGNATASIALGNAVAGQTFVIGALRMSLGAAQTITFTDTTADTINIESGGLMSDGAAFTRTIGATTSAATRGRLTAGLTTATTPQELFLHNNANTLQINAQIIDNPFNVAATVKVVKDLDGTVLLDTVSGVAIANTYSGGTAVLRGTLTANGAGSLGTGGVFVKNSVLNLGNLGSTTGAVGIAANSAVYTTSDQAEIILTNTTAYSGAGDRFNISAGSQIYANSPGAGLGLNSLTRVATPTSFTTGGQIYLAPDAIVRQNMTNGIEQGTGILTIQNLGTAADLYFSPGTAGGVLQTLTVGAGTPWKGISTDRSASSWTTGTINANSDFYLQGLIRDQGVVALTLGGDNTAGNISIINSAGKAINAFIIGNVALAEDSPVRMPGDLTFVVTPGAIFQPNRSASFGNPTLVGGGIAKVIVQAGGTLDPGNFVALGSAANQDTATRQSLPYPVASPLNGSLTVEAGGQFLINDVSGIGSAPVGSYLMKTDSILHLATNNAFFGRGNQPFDNILDTTGYINPGQFVLEPGIVVRVEADVLKLSQFITGVTNGEKSILEIYNGNRTITNQNNPFIKPVTGSPTIQPEDIRLASGGMLTNDASDRQLSEGRGRLVLGNGAVLAGTSQTYINIQEGLNVEANATITIGSTRWVDGMPKLGGVQLLGPNSNVIPASATVNIVDGAQLMFAAVNVWPDYMPINLPTAVTAFPSAGALAIQPGNGTSLSLNTATSATVSPEIIGQLTGSGAVLANQATAYLGVGGGGVGNFTSNNVIKSTNGQNPGLWKIGSSVMTYTGVSDSAGFLIVAGGELKYTGTGVSAFAENKLTQGGLLTLDNNVGAAVSNRLGGITKSLTPGGGTYNLIGNATTAVEERYANIFNSNGTSGSFIGNPATTTIKITPGAATTNVLINSAETFQSAGIALQRSATVVLNTATAANAPITYTTANTIVGGIVPGNTATTNGLIQFASPNFVSVATFGSAAGGQFTSAGSTVAATRPDYLGDANNDGIPEGFMTEDGITLGVTNTLASAVVTGLVSTSGLLAGMPVQGTFANGTKILSVDSATQVTLTNPSTTALTSLQIVAGGMRNLAASEYSSTFRDNQSTGQNVKLSGTTTIAGDTRVQTLTMTPGSTLNISGVLPFGQTATRLHLNGAGVFVQSGGTATINGGTSGNSRNFLQANTGASLYLHTIGNLDLNAAVFSDNGVVKTGAGILNVGSGAFNAFRGSLTIDAGTVNLGTNNSFANIRATTGSTSNARLYMNGGTLNLNGNSEMISTLNSANELAGTGGLVTSNAAATLTILGDGRFGGTLGGLISVDKVGNTTNIWTSANTYTGSTLIRAGTLILRDSGALTTTSLTVQDATLQFDNGYISNVVNRIPVATPVFLRGGTINITGAAGQVASQTFNTVNLVGGTSNFTSNAGGSGANEIYIGNLVRAQGQNGNGASVNFQQNYGFLGTAGNTSTAIRNFITNVNGSALTLNDGVLAGWAVVAGSNFASYLGTTGIGALGNTADGYAAYDSADVTTALATHNVSDIATARTITAGKTINSYRIPTINGTTSVAAVITLNPGVALTLDTGGFIADNNNTVSLNAGTATVGLGAPSITSNSGELDLWINQNTTSVNVPIVGAIDLVKSGGGALNIRPEGSYTVTNVSGTNLMTTTATTGLAVGMPVSGTGIPAGSTITAITAGASFTISNVTTGVVTTVVPLFGNSYTGRTIVNAGGLVTLNASSAGVAGFRTIPGDLFINGVAVVTEANFANQINPAANVTFSGGGRLNMLGAASTTETLASLTFLDGSGTNTGLGLDRATQQNTSVLNLTASTAITANNTNPTAGVPFIGGFIGSVGFTPSSGASTLLINSPVAPSGVLAVGLRMDGAFGAVPTGITDGGLIKDGAGLLAITTSQTNAQTLTTVNASNVLTGANTLGYQVGMPVTGTGIPAGSFITAINPNVSITISQNATAGAAVAVTGAMFNFNQTALTYNGTTASLTDVFNVKTGIVRVDVSGGLGTNSANTTVQSGAVLLGSAGTITGSVRLKDGAFLGTTINAFSMGNATLVAANQSVLNVPTGNVTIGLYDYFVQSTDSKNITINGRLTGAGNITIVGQQLTQGSGSGSVLTLGNPILTGTGSTDYSGTITVNENAILQNQVALAAVTTNVRSTGDALGTATINLNGGRLRFRDDATAGATAVNNTTVAFANNVTLSADSYIDAGRANATDTISGNIISLGTLTVASGTKVLTVDSSTATTAGAGLGNYQTSFSQLIGPGTLVKAGQGAMTLGSTAANSSFTLAGAVGRSVAHTFNLATGTQPITFTAASNSFTNFGVGGFYITPAAKTFNVSGTFSVNANADNVSGQMAVTNTTVINAATFQNNGQVGATGGTATITATAGFTGSGLYVGSGQALNLAGNVTGGALKVAGDSTVNVTGTSLSLAGAQVQSGTLKLTPTTAAASSGTLRVFGSPAQTIATDGIPVAAVTGTLQLDGTAGSITHTGNITNNGLVRASAGTTTISGTIGGTTIQYVPGLLEGFLANGTLDASAARAANPGNMGIRMEPRMFQTNAVTQNLLTGHLDNETWVYTGYIKDNDGVFSFAENVDDNALISIDGVNRLVNNTGTNPWQTVTTTAYSSGLTGTATQAGANTGTPSQNFGAGVTLAGFGSGWHAIEIRFVNGAGGAGPVVANGFTANYGLGYKDGIGAFDGADYIKPIDDGTGNLFVTAVGGKGNVQVDGAATLKAGGITLTNNLTLASAASGAAFEVTAGAASDVDNLITTGTSGKANLTISNVAGVLTVNTGINFAAGTTLKKDGTGTVNFYNTAAVTGAGSVLELNQGTAEFANAALGTANVNFTGNSTLRWKTGNTQDVSAQIQAIGTGVTATLDTQANNVTLATGLSGAGGVTKAGSGTLTSTASNGYTGITTISNGTLALTGAGAIADSSAVNLTAASAVLDISGITAAGETVGSLAGVAGSSVVLGGKTLSAGGDNSATTFAGAVSGTGGLTKEGSATMSLTGTSNFTGTTTVNAGTLAVSGGGLTGTTAVSVNAGTLLLGASNVINDAASVTLGAGSTLNTGGFSDTLGALTLTANSTIDFGAGNASELTFTTLTLGGNSLNIWNWTATNPNVAQGSDNGTAGDGLRDRLLFTTLGTLSTAELSQIHFFSDAGSSGLGDGRQISFGGNQELVPVPEPTTIFGALALVGLVGYRERRRLRAAKAAVGGWMAKTS